jgi:UDP-N-acetyl-D-galactosamine dehydrogenase
VIENSQRDINIAFVNELAKIFNILGIDTSEVLEAAGTKWNFQKYMPGLVGGHCIGVDPYYLAHKAQEVGYHPEIILAGRKINDGMGKYIANQVVKLMIKKEISLKEGKALILGITFKENCKDIRNSKSIEIFHELRSFQIDVDFYDPMADALEVEQTYGITLQPEPPEDYYSAIILAVAHSQFDIGLIEKTKKKLAVVYDVKSVLPKRYVDERL